MAIDASPCFAKLSRAREHLEQLKQQPEEVRRANLYTADIHRDGRYVVARLRVLAPMPRHLPCIVGDIVHNIRCSLDHLACLAVESSGGTITRSTQFPIVEEA